MQITDTSISGNSPSTSLVERPANPVPGQQGPKNSVTGAIASDQTDLSGVAGKLSELLQPEPGRSERIRELQQAVANGTYRVDSASVSRAIVDEAIGATNTSSPHQS